MDSQTVELPRSVELRLNLLNYAGLKPLKIENVQTQIAQMGEGRWIKWKNQVIEERREYIFTTGSGWQRERIKEVFVNEHNPK